MCGIDAKLKTGNQYFNGLCMKCNHMPKLKKKCKLRHTLFRKKKLLQITTVIQVISQKLILLFQEIKKRSAMSDFRIIIFSKQLAINNISHLIKAL